MNEPINLLFCGHDQKFINSYIDHCNDADKYSVSLLEHKGHVLQDIDLANKKLLNADVIFCEWCLGNAVWFSQNKKPNQILIIRLHLQEVQSRSNINFIWEVDWDSVDRLIVITHHIFDWMSSNFSYIKNKITLVYNPIPALSDFNLSKNDTDRFNLGFVGMVPARKRFDLAIKILRKVRKVDDRYSLHVKGAMPSEYAWMKSRHDEMAWYENIFKEAKDLVDCGAIQFYEHGDGMAAWYQKIGYILSVSDFEGSHQAVAEAMATGSIPVIRNWTGAEFIYPRRFISEGIDGLAKLIIDHQELDNFHQASEKSKKYSQDMFDQEYIHHQLDGIISQELRNKRPRVKNHTLASSYKRAPSFAIVAYIPLKSGGGYRTRVEQEIKIFSMLGCKISLICILPMNEMELASEIDRKIVSKRNAELGATTTFVAIKDFFGLNLNSSEISAAVESISQQMDFSKIDVLHAEALYCARFAEFIKQKHSNLLLSVDWHGVLPEESRMSGAHDSRIKMLEAEERRLLASTDLNIFVSHEMSRFYHNKYELKRGDKEVIVPCCISHDMLVAFSEGANTKNITYGYIGTLTDWQCGDEMFRIFKSISLLDKSARFKLLSPLADHPRIEALISEHEINRDSVTFCEVPHTEISDNFQDVDVAFLLRHKDPVNLVASPTKFGEYLAFGKPIIMSSEIGDFSDHAIANKCALVLEDFFEANLAQKIVNFSREVKLNKQNYHQICQNSVSEYLSWELNARSWLHSILKIYIEEVI